MDADTGGKVEHFSKYKVYGKIRISIIEDKKIKENSL